MAAHTHREGRFDRWKLLSWWWERKVGYLLGLEPGRWPRCTRGSCGLVVGPLRLVRPLAQPVLLRLDGGCDDVGRAGFLMATELVVLLAEWGDGAEGVGLRERRARKSAPCDGRALSNTLPHHDSYRTHRLTVATAAVFEAAYHAFALGTRRVSVTTAVGAVLLAASRRPWPWPLHTVVLSRASAADTAWSGWWCWWRPGGDGERTVAARRHSHAMGCRSSSEGDGCR